MVPTLITYPESNYVIFAAGVGSRLNAEVPKFLVNVGDCPLFQYQLSQLRTFSGCIYIVCGYRAEVVREHVNLFVRDQTDFIPKVCFVHNPQFRQSQVTSIAKALAAMPLDQRTFLIDGDVLFHRKTIESLHRFQETTVVVRADVSKDAVMAATNADDRLVSFSRDSDGQLEWANIAQYQPKDLCHLTKIVGISAAVHHFELINELVTDGCDIRVHQDTVAEIDEPEDLENALEFVRGIA